MAKSLFSQFSLLIHVVDVRKDSHLRKGLDEVKTVDVGLLDASGQDQAVRVHIREDRPLRPFAQQHSPLMGAFRPLWIGPSTTNSLVLPQDEEGVGGGRLNNWFFEIN